MNEFEQSILQVLDAYKAAVFAKDVDAFSVLWRRFKVKYLDKGKGKRKVVPQNAAQHRHATDVLCRGDFGSRKQGAGFPDLACLCQPVARG